MPTCETCEAAPARPRSRFCTERCRARARRRWARGLPANAVQGDGRGAELIREAALREGEQVLKPAKEIADHLDALTARLGPKGVSGAIDRARARRAA
jgi:hypothetical protein